MGKYNNDYFREWMPDLFFKMQGHTPDDSFYSNGCTCSPDKLGPANFLPACHFHDWVYRQDRYGMEAHRERADRNLYFNMIECGASKRVATFYYMEVRLFGRNLFSYAPGQKPAFWRVFFGRFVWW